MTGEGKPAMTRRCAWCGTELEPLEGPELTLETPEGDMPVCSHGICIRCEELLELELQEEDG